MVFRLIVFFCASLFVGCAFYFKSLHLDERRPLWRADAAKEERLKDANLGISIDEDDANISTQ